MTEVVPDRLNDQRQSAIILVQQRTAERDCSGTLLSLGADYTHLSVPMAANERAADQKEAARSAMTHPRSVPRLLVRRRRFG